MSSDRDWLASQGTEEINSNSDQSAEKPEKENLAPQSPEGPRLKHLCNPKLEDDDMLNRQLYPGYQDE